MRKLTVIILALLFIANLAFAIPPSSTIFKSKQQVVGIVQSMDCREVCAGVQNYIVPSTREGVSELNSSDLVGLGYNDLNISCRIQNNTGGMALCAPIVGAGFVNSSEALQVSLSVKEGIILRSGMPQGMKTNAPWFGKNVVNKTSTSVANSGYAVSDVVGVKIRSHASMLVLPLVVSRLTPAVVIYVAVSGTPTNNYVANQTAVIPLRC
ncbi:MAG: hypothetical protein AAB657_04210 [Patescibacteria group bacterium]